MRRLWRSRAGRTALTALGLILAGLAAGSAITKIAGRSVLGSLPESNIVVHAQGKAQVPVSFANGFVPAVERAAPAVVNVFSERVVRVTEDRNTSPLFEDPFFRRFFGEGTFGGRQVPQERIERSLGSGVIVTADGYILTSAHVVEQSQEVRVAMADGKEFDVKVVGVDAPSEVAVLKANATNLPVIPIGDSSKVDVGDFALAMGNPFGVGQTVTQGIVSATGRYGLGISTYEDFIQTDAAINRGNSGGALTNYRGDLIGLNTAILSPTGGFQGLGFAVPINMAMNVMRQIMQHGRVIRGYLGVSIQEVTPELAKALGLKQEGGALIGGVTAGGPAAAAGLQPGDVVIAADNKPINNPRELQQAITPMKPGATATLQIIRNGRQQQVTVKIGEMPAETARGGAQPGAPETESPLAGVSVAPLTPDIARQLQLPPNTQGVVVTDVAEGSSAAFAGLERGVVIQQVNRKPVISVQQFTTLVRQAGNQPILLLVYQDGSTRFVVVSPERIR